MEDCFVVEGVVGVEQNNYISVLGGNYDGLNIVQLVPTGYISQNNQVITVAKPSLKTDDQLHPLEAHVRFEGSRHDQLSRLPTASVIQALPSQSNATSVLRTINRADIQESSLVLSASNLISLEKDDGDKMLWGSQSSNPLTFSNPLLQTPQQPTEELMELEDVQIPATIHSCSELIADNKDCSDSGSEDEATIRPVYDHEPDPGPPDPALVESKEDMTNRCYMCFRKFRQKKNMYAHIRKIHSTQPKIMGGIVCPLCKMSALRQEHLRNHLLALHQIQIEKEEKQFDFLSEFLSWKTSVEKATGCTFVSKSSSKILSFNQTKTYFKCHKSGSYESEKIEKRKKKANHVISAKIGATCPAAMELTEQANGVTVTFWSTHVGHAMDPVLPVVDTKNNAKKNTGTSEKQWSNNLNGDQLNGATNKTNVKEEVKTVKPVVKKSLRKPRVSKRASKAMVVEKAREFCRLLESTDVYPEARPQICSMIDNIIATVLRKTKKPAKRKRAKRSKEPDHLDLDAITPLTTRQTSEVVRELEELYSEVEDPVNIPELQSDHSDTDYEHNTISDVQVT